MINLYFAPPPNGWKAAAMLEECELPYQVKNIDIGKGDQFQEAFLKISPNNKIPAIVDRDPTHGRAPVSVFETGAILLYLAQKSGRFLPEDPDARVAALEWLFWQVGGLGPMMGQHGHFKLYAPEPIDYAINRYRREVLRLFHVLDTRLSDAQYLAGDDISVADFACFPWVQIYRAQDIDLTAFPAVSAWYERLKERPRLRQGMALGRDRIVRRPQDDAGANKVLFGN